MTGCSVNNKYFSDGRQWIPDDFDPGKTTLLVEHYPGREKWNDEMMNYLASKYPGKYEVVSKDQIIAMKGKYSDTKVYKYAVLWGAFGGTSFNTFTGGTTVNYYQSTKIDFYGHFLDRTSGKEYPITKKYNNYGSKGYIPFINSVVKYTE